MAFAMLAGNRFGFLVNHIDKLAANRSINIALKNALTVRRRIIAMTTLRWIRVNRNKYPLTIHFDVCSEMGG